MDELDSAIDWALSRGPKIFNKMEDKYYIYKTGKTIGFPMVRILYKYDEPIHTITLLSIEEIKSNL